MNTVESMRLFNEFEYHLMKDLKPSEYFNRIIDKEDKIRSYPFTMLSDLIKVPQSPKHHPEGNVWNHTMLVIDNAAIRKNKSEDKRAFMWAALLHDIGKSSTTKIIKDKITAYDHDKVGETLVVKFLNEFMNDDTFIYKVSKLVKWHMQPLFVSKNMVFADVDQMITEVSIEEIALLSICDRLGRGEMTADRMKKEIDSIEYFKMMSKKKE